MVVLSVRHPQEPRPGGVTQSLVHCCGMVSGHINVVIVCILMVMRGKWKVDDIAITAWDLVCPQENHGRPRQGASLR